MKAFLFQYAYEVGCAHQSRGDNDFIVTIITAPTVLNYWSGIVALVITKSIVFNIISTNRTNHVMLLKLGVAKYWDVAYLTSC